MTSPGCGGQARQTDLLIGFLAPELGDGTIAFVLQRAPCGLFALRSMCISTCGVLPSATLPILESAAVYDVLALKTLLQ